MIRRVCLRVFGVASLILCAVSVAAGRALQQSYSDGGYANPAGSPTNYGGVTYGGSSMPMGCPFGPTLTVPNGQWYTGLAKICYCDNGQWTQCRDIQSAPPAYTPPAYTPAPPKYDNPCNDYGVTVPHGQTYTRQDGQTCRCDNGGWAGCYAPAPPTVPQKCYYQGQSVWNGGYLTTDTQRCLCQQGQLVQCQPLAPPAPPKCWWNGHSVNEGQWLSKGYQECLCRYGQLVQCRDICQPGKAQVMFLFDTSLSITEDEHSESDSEVGARNWDAIQNFAGGAISRLPIGPDGVRVALSRFSDDPSTVVSFSDPASTNKGQLLDFLNHWNPRLHGQTYLGEALASVRRQFPSSWQNSRVLVVITDGNADDNISNIASSMRNDGFIIWAVGVGNIEVDRLFSLTGDSDRVLYVESFSRLVDNISFLTRAVCYNYNA